MVFMKESLNNSPNWFIQNYWITSIVYWSGSAVLLTAFFSKEVKQAGRYVSVAQYSSGQVNQWNKMWNAIKCGIFKYEK